MRATHLPLLLGGLGLALGAAAVVAARQQKAARASERRIAFASIEAALGTRIDAVIAAATTAPATTLSPSFRRG
jgi:hypothetical protein